MGKYQAYPEYRDSEVSGLGTIPSHWEVMQLKRTVDGCVNGIWGSEPKKDGHDTIVLRVADFDRPKLSLQDDGYTYRKIEDKEKITRKLKRGDLLLEKSGGGEKTLVGQVVLFDKDFEAVTSNFVAKMTPNEGFNSRFLNYVFSRFYSDNINYCSIKQNTGIQNLDSAAYLAEKFGFPLEQEQEKIANFLDHETAKIDILIEKQQQLIALLKEKRQAVISHAVTKGLNPNAPMKNSGVEWLGDVPKHWEVKRLKNTSDVIDCRNKTPEYFDDGEYFVVRTTNIKNQKLNMNGALYTDEANFKIWTQRGVPPAGSIFFTREAPAGEICLVPENLKFCMGQRMMNFICHDSEYTNYLFDFLLSDCLERYIESVSHGSTVSHLRVEQVENIPVIVPPADEAKAIHEELAATKAKYSQLTDEAEKAIGLMQERRTALISAAVTGKIDVRNWQAPTSNSEVA